MHTLFGRFRLWRPYYHCARCHQGRVPWDQTLGLNSQGLTPAAQEVITLAGTQIAFPKASQKILKKLSGLHVSESTVQRTTEAAGLRLRQLYDAGVRVGEAMPWTWEPDAQGRSCAYVSIDATGVRQQGPGGVKAEGRMAYVAKIYSPAIEERSAAAESQEPQELAQEVPPSRANKKKRRKASSQPRERYFAGFYDLPTFGLRLRKQAAQVGWDDAEQQIALSDGGAGLEEFFRQNFPRAECILDFWHAQEHLVELAQVWFGADEAARQAWLAEQRRRLKYEGGQAVLDQLEALDLTERSAAAQQAHEDHTQYFRNHVHRMDYPRYLANGWQIGSGPVEAACKTVVAERLKCSGMRWGEDGADAVCHLRALYLSEPQLWDAFWRDHPN